MCAVAMPISGVTPGQTLTFRGIHQRVSFPVHVDPQYINVLQAAHVEHPYRTVVAVYDQAVPNVARFIEDVRQLLDVPLLKLPLEAGEQLKTLPAVEKMVHALSAHGISGKSLMLVIGGGTLCNAAGFVATMWKGMEPLIVPTNVTAIGDVAIGSLHMMNVGHVKNALHLYHDPLGVVVDSQFIATLTVAERRNGLAEAVKHAVAQDVVFFEQLEAHIANGTVFHDDVTIDLALRTAQLKDALFADAPFGEHTQCILRYGHIVAHAIEPAMDYHMPHGEAVALGILSELAFFHPPTSFTYVRVQSMLQSLGLPTCFPSALRVAMVMEHLAPAMTEQGILMVPRVEQLGGLAPQEGSYMAAFQRASVRNVLRRIAREC